MNGPPINIPAMTAETEDRGGTWFLLPLALWRSPLTRSGYSLIASAGITSVLGLVFWVAAARLYTADQVGLSAALISTLLTLGNISQLNFGNLLNRFLPVAGNWAAKLIWLSYATVVIAAAVTSAGFLFGIGGFVRDLDFLHDSPWTISAFVAASVLWTVFALQDSVLAGLRYSTVVPIENAIYALAKLCLLVLLGLFAAQLDFGVFAAWALPLPLVVVATNLFIFVKFLPKHSAANAGQPVLDRSSMLKFFGWDYVGTLAIMFAMGAAPLLVLKFDGPTAIATYHLAWTICYPLYLISRSMGVSLLTEAVSDPARMPGLIVEAIVHSMLPHIGAAAVMFIGAPWIMMLFGPYYVETGVPLVRILVLSTIPWGLVTIYLAVARARGHTISIAAVQIVTLLIVLGLGPILLGRVGALGIGWAWLAAHTVVAAGIFVHIVVRDGTDRIASGLYQMAATLARVYTGLFGRGARQALPPGNEAILARLCKSAGFADPSSWRPVNEIATLSDVRTIFIGKPAGSGDQSDLPQTPLAVLKFSASDIGNNAVQKALVARRLLDEGLGGYHLGIAFPDTLATEHTAGNTWVLERMLAGIDGRRALLEPQSRVGALRDAVRVMDLIHQRTAASKTIDDEWLSRWIDTKLVIVGRAALTFMRAKKQHVAMAEFRREQYEFWKGRSSPLGIGHGDFSPGNLLFDFHPEANGSGALQQLCAPRKVNAIVDWESMTMNAPPGFDAVHLAMTARAHFSREEVGAVVSEFVTSPEWSDEEAAWLSADQSAITSYAGWPRDRNACRALAGLAWLSHVAANLEKSDRYARNRLWVAGNVERVLRVYHARAGQP
jgi:O-antigen/teichoic acid export membrane protein